jgi:hypothetical protein
MTIRKLGFSALMVAIYGRLTTHDLTKTYTFYNHVPRTAAMPYHVISKPVGTRSLGFTTRDTEAEDNVIYIDSWIDEASGEGDKVCADRMNNITQAITSSSLSITGYHPPARAILDYSDIVKDDSEISRDVRHGTQRFRFEMAPSS